MKVRDGLIILGVDPGYRRTGFGVISHDGERAKCLYHGGLNLPNESLALRLHRIFEHTGKLIDKHRPTVLSIEEVFVANNPSSALKLGHARAAAILAGADAGISVAEYSNRVVKQALTGRGNADKAQVAYMVAQQLEIENDLDADESDALALAICYAQDMHSNEELRHAG